MTSKLTRVNCYPRPSTPLWELFRERTFFVGGGGPGLRRGGSLVNFLHIADGQTCFIVNRGRVTVFLARKKLLHVASILYIQAKLPVKINLNYLQVSKSLYIKKLSSPNQHNCLSRPVSAFAHILMFPRGVL